MNEERGLTYKNRVSEWKAGVAELADALDSKSSGRKAVWDRAPPPAPSKNAHSGHFHDGFMTPRQFTPLPRPGLLQNRF